MEYEGNERRQLFELRPSGKEKEGILVDKRRMIVGSSEQCDIVLNYPDIGPIHAILEMTKDGKKLYDMNTASGCFINGEKAIDGSYQEGDKLKFGSHEFEFKKFVKEEVLPPVLDMLDPTLPPRVTPVTKGEIPKPPPSISSELPTPTGKPAHVPKRKPYVTKVAYPLAEDPKAEYSEYIFEDTEDLIPIFSEVEKASVEVVIMFGDEIFSVNYLPVKDGRFRLVGRSPSSKEVESPFLPKKEKIELITISGGQIQVNPIPGYDSLVLADVGGPTRENEGPITLGEDDIVRFFKNEVQIFVRQSSSPPKVKSAPIFPKDGAFSKILAAVYVILALFLIWMQFFVEVDKEQEEEKAAKRIARILRKPKPKPKPKPKVKAKTAAKKVAATPTPSKAKKTRVKKTKAPKKVAKKAPPKKAAPKKAKVKRPKKVVTRKPKPKKKAGPPKARKKAPTKSVARKAPRKKSKGRVETYKSFSFKSSISSSLAKGGALDVAAKTRAREADMGIEGSVGGGGATDVKKAKIDSGVGSLAGATQGRLESGSSVSGLSEKRSIYTAGVPGRTVVLGSIDPDIIRRILMDHIPQFRHCYQRELDDSSGGFSGMVKMNFIIGASGSVTKAGVESTDGSLTKSVRGCITGVIRGIKFPRPRGGGVVEVSQPFSFFPKKS